VLEQILDHHRARVAVDERDLDALLAAAAEAPPPRDFAGALSRPGISLIAEVKRRSPSRGDLALDLDPGELAKSYAAGGAAAVSVLTDERFFGGSWVDLGAAREASGLPVLRKDFTLDERDVADARIGGADAVLLIVAALEVPMLERLIGLAGELDLAALVETHDEAEIAVALDSGAAIVGVNQRNLGDFSVDPDRATRLAGLIPDPIVRVAESGLRGPGDVRRAADAGFDAVLVGEQLVTHSDPEGETRRLLAQEG
jgi:indole-3-glycerol phosphate synthase